MVSNIKGLSVCPTFGGSNPGLWAELIHSVKEQLSPICGCAFRTSPVGFMACPAFASVSNHSPWTSMTSRRVNQEDNFCELRRLEAGVYILSFTGEIHHRFSPEAIQYINESLDQVARDTSACALITTNQGKFFSNGMDLNYLKEVDLQGAMEYLLMFQRLVSKLLTFCIPTIAVIRGHAVGAGCIFALAHDYRLMSSNRGYIFINEVDLGMSLTPGNVAVLRSKLPISTFQEAILTGKHYDGNGATAASIVHATHPTGPALLQTGINKVMEYKVRNWNREAYHALEMEMFKTTVRELEIGGIGFARM